MTMFEWNEQYSVQIGSIDAQHRALFAMAHELHQAMMQGRGNQQIGTHLERLIDYTASHFAHEERLMRLHDYPDRAAHQAEHQALAQKVVQFQADFRAGRIALSPELLTFMKDWLVRHIQGSDRKYVPYLRSRIG